MKLKRATPATRLPAGFTLTDLLVIVAGVSLVSVILSAQLVAAKTRGRLATCMGNRSKVNQSVLPCATDNHQRLPALAAGDKRNLWWWYKEQVKSYAGLRGESSPSDTVFACPADRGYTDPIPFS